jgi:ADP-ribosylglycohydrolase
MKEFSIMEYLEEHILGCLYGVAVGDAMGTAAYLVRAESVVKLGRITDFLTPAEDNHIHHGFRRGQVTDDTEQTVALAEAIIADGAVTPEGVARALIGWYGRVGGDSAPWVGPSTRRALRAIKSGADPRTTGEFGTTNGAAMRVTPAGCIHPGDIPAAVESAARACQPTHYTAVAVASAGAVAAAVAAAIVPGATIDTLIDAACAGAELGSAYGHREFLPNVARRIRWAVGIGRSRRDEAAILDDLYDYVGVSLAIHETVPAAFAVLAMADGDPMRTALLAANLAGDADTTGAIACGVAGALRGISAFPADALDLITTTNPVYDFPALARGLAQVAAANRRIGIEPQRHRERGENEEEDEA